MAKLYLLDFYPLPLPPRALNLLIRRIGGIIYENLDTMIADIQQALEAYPLIIQLATSNRDSNIKVKAYNYEANSRTSVQIDYMQNGEPRTISIGVRVIDNENSGRNKAESA